MSTHMKIALAVALILGTASAVLANDNERDQPASTSQAERDWREWQQGLFRHHMDNGNTAFGYVGKPNRTQSRKSR